jgi:hypothetical protein
MTFSVGDIVTASTHSEMGQGEVLVIINSETIGVRFEGHTDYQDDDLEDSDYPDYPDLPDFHYVAIKNARHVEYRYDPTQAGDTDEDI